MKEKICKNCNKLYKTYKDTQLFCSRQCSSENQRIERVVVTCENINCNNTFEIYKKSKTKQKRFCSTTCQSDWQKTYQLGERNGNFGRKNSWGYHPIERRLDISKKIKESWKSPSRLKKHLEFLERHRLEDGSFDFQNDEFRDKISKANIARMQSGIEYNAYASCKSGYYKSIKTNDDEYYQSSWELEAMQKLDTNLNVVFWTKKHGYVIEYKYEGYLKRYLPDFLIHNLDNTKTILEVKGYIKDKDVDIFKSKCESALYYCKQLGIDYDIDFMYNSSRYSNLIEWFKMQKKKIYG